MPHLWQESYHNAVEIFLKQYKRPVTVFEMCRKNPFSFSLSKASGVFVMYREKDSHAVVKNLQQSPRSNLVILDPLQWDAATAQRLARCEYFDVVIVKDMDFRRIQSYITALAELGDYIFLEISEAELKPYLHLFEWVRCIVQSSDNKKLFVLKTHKRGLDVARWNLSFEFSHQSIFNPRYCVESSFTHKQLHKNGKITEWIPGINLMTFIMMRGIYPTNEFIKNELLKLSSIDHNDLVLGNFVVMGAHKIVPIDFKDPRRKIDPKRCLAAALAYFSDNKARFKNPRESLHYYQHALRAHK
jgi:hypothetical protein